MDYFYSFFKKESDRTIYKFTSEKYNEYIIIWENELEIKNKDNKKIIIKILPDIESLIKNLNLIDINNTNHYFKFTNINESKIGFINI